MAAAVDDRDDDVPVVLPGLRFGRGHRLLGLIKGYRRAIVTNTFMNGGLRRSDAFAAGKFHVEPPSPSSFTSLDHLVGAGEQRLIAIPTKKWNGSHLQQSSLCASSSVLFKLRPRSAQDSNRPNHQQPEWKHPQAWNRLQSQSRQQEPLPTQHHEQQQRCPKIHHPHNRRQRGGESADGIGAASDGEGKGKPLFREFDFRLFAWFHSRSGHPTVIGNWSVVSRRLDRRRWSRSFGIRLQRTKNTETKSAHSRAHPLPHGRKCSWQTYAYCAPR